MRLEHWFYTIPLRLRSLLRRDNVEQDLDDELRDHMERKIEEYIARGSTPEEARYAALRAMQGLEQRKEECRDMRHVAGIENLTQEFRFGVRMLAKAPAFTAAAVVTLALGIGGTTAVFSLIHAVMLRSLPVSEPENLYRIGEGYDVGPNAELEGHWGLYSMDLYTRLKAALPEFQDVAAFEASSWGVVVRREGRNALSQSLRKEFVTGNYFRTLGIRSLVGHLISESDDRAGSPPVAVLSYQAWQNNFAGDPALLGSSIVIGGHPFSVIGITPPGFFGDTLRAEPTELWLPMQQEPLLNPTDSALNSPGDLWVRAIGRLRTGEDITGIGPRLTGILRRWLLTDSGYPAWMPDIKRTLGNQEINLIPATGGVTEMKGDYQRSLQVLFAFCGLVLLIACVNIANLLLARELARRRQTALRIAVGASRIRIVRQSLIESILLALLGSAVGLLVAKGLARLIVTLTFSSSEFLSSEPTLSAPILLFSLAMVGLTSIMFGAVPAWLASHADPAETLRGMGRSTADEASAPRQGFLVLQAALSVLLLAGTGLLTRSLKNLEQQNFGFETANRIDVTVDAAPNPYDFKKLATLFRKVEEGVNQLPGVENAGLATNAPLNVLNMTDRVYVDGHPAQALTGLESWWGRVTPRYLSAVGQNLLRGRQFKESDNDSGELVAIVNQSFVNKYLLQEEALGKRFGIFKPVFSKTFRIVGIVRDAKYEEAKTPARSMFFLPESQEAGLNHEYDLPDHFSHRLAGLVVTTHLPVGTLEHALKEAFHKIDPDLAVVSIRTMKEHVDRALSQQHAVATLATIFSIMALILAGVGLYGVTAFTVLQRTNEIGVRMVLGADRREVIRLVLLGAFKSVAIGLGLGIALVPMAGKALSFQLYGVSLWDPLPLSVAVLSLAASALMASIVPALRAASIEPVTVLRLE